MNRSQQTWVKTFMQDVMDEKGQVLFDNLTWFGGYTTSVDTDCHNQMWKEQCVSMTTSSSGREQHTNDQGVDDSDDDDINSDSITECQDQH